MKIYWRKARAQGEEDGFSLARGVDFLQEIQSTSLPAGAYN